MKRTIIFTVPLILTLFSTEPSQSGFRFGVGNAVSYRMSNNIVGQPLEAVPTLVLPCDAADVRYTLYGIYPFGVVTLDHPNGHPGIDFELREGAPIYASASGYLCGGCIESNPTDGGLPSDTSILIYHKNGYFTIYNGPLKNILVSPNQFVSKGQKIAEMAVNYFPGFQEGRVHWGISKDTQGGVSPTGLCPTDYMTPTALTVLQQLFAKTIPNVKYPSICNPCGAGGCR